MGLTFALLFANISATDTSETDTSKEVFMSNVNQPLTPAVFHILLALADGDKHGYAIMKDVESQTDGHLKLGPGTLYGTIKRLLSAGLIVEADERPDPELDDERRRYYRLTALGRQSAQAENQRLQQAVQSAQQRLSHSLNEEAFR
jgi:DNA-binding PadR family transcriptional regulator